MDVDGGDVNKYGNLGNWQAGTTMSINSDKKSTPLNTDTVPYIVIPLNHKIKSVISGPGSFALVYDTKTGRSCSAIVGDRGPYGKTGEGSIAVFKKLKLEIPSAKNNYSRAGGGEEDNRFKYIIYTKKSLGTNYKGNEKTLLDKIENMKKEMKTKLKKTGYNMKNLK